MMENPFRGRVGLPQKGFTRSGLPHKALAQHQLGRTGLACLQDLETPEWRSLFRELDAFQCEFLAKESQFRSQEYAWPRDPLHTWSRVWEYPYVLHQVRQWKTELPARMCPHIVDLGSGVTFFPFVVARDGCLVTAVDPDPVCETDLQRAIECIPLPRGAVRFRKGSAEAIPLEPESVDCVLCISVLEHLRDPAEAIPEIARVTKPGGLFILTFDIALSGNLGLRPDGFWALREAVQQHFQLVCTEATVHPGVLLTSEASLFPSQHDDGASGGLARAAVRKVSRILKMGRETVGLGELVKSLLRGSRTLVRSLARARKTEKQLLACFGGTYCRL